MNPDNQPVRPKGRFKKRTPLSMAFWETLLQHLSTTANVSTFSEIDTRCNRSKGWFRVLYHHGKPLSPYNLELVINSCGITEPTRAELHVAAARGIGYDLKIVNL